LGGVKKKGLLSFEEAVSKPKGGKKYAMQVYIQSLLGK
jgi:hypothetical protein